MTLPVIPAEPSTTKNKATRPTKITRSGNMEKKKDRGRDTSEGITVAIKKNMIPNVIGGITITGF